MNVPKATTLGRQLIRDIAWDYCQKYARLDWDFMSPTPNISELLDEAGVDTRIFYSVTTYEPQLDEEDALTAMSVLARLAGCRPEDHPVSSTTDVESLIAASTWNHYFAHPKLSDAEFRKELLKLPWAIFPPVDPESGPAIADPSGDWAFFGVDYVGRF